MALRHLEPLDADGPSGGPSGGRVHPPIRTGPYIAFNPDELRDYRESQKDFWDLNSALETAERKARTEGEAIGIEKGLKKGEAIGIEKGLKKGEAIGVDKTKQSVTETMRSQGYSEEQIKALMNAMN